MRELRLRAYEDVTADTLQRLSNNSPGGILCPRLERLHWDACGTDNALLFVRLFLSPSLKKVTLYNYLLLTQSDLSIAIARVISLLPISLQDVSIEPGYEGDEALVDAVSSFICRCGPSLRSFSTRTPLSEVAIRYVIQLPNLRSWTVTRGPPRTVPASILPSLEQLHLDRTEALPWLHLLASRQKGIVHEHSASAMSHARTRESLKSITCPGSAIVDSTLLSSLITFRNLATLRVQPDCPGEEVCMFRLTDDDMENLATALPRLEILELGSPCDYDSCNNTVASLLSISVHCLDLTVLETHFNARTIVGDMQRLFDGGIGSDRAKCKLSRLMVSLPFEVRGKDIRAVMVRLKVIFPCLEAVGYDGYWRQLSSELGDR